jgi:type II secretory pathway component PulM
MLARNRNAILVGVACVLTAVAYAGLAEPLGYKIEWAGVTMLFALGAAMGIMIAVLGTGSGD